MIFELVKDFSATLAAMPAEHPKRRTVELLEEAIRPPALLCGLRAASYATGPVKLMPCNRWRETRGCFRKAGLVDFSAGPRRAYGSREIPS